MDTLRVSRVWGKTDNEFAEILFLLRFDANREYHSHESSHESLLVAWMSCVYNS